VRLGWPGWQAATGEEVTPNELGGAELHCTTSGVADHLAENEDHAISIARTIVSNLHPAGAPSARPAVQPRAGWEEPLHPPEELRGNTSASLQISQ
jgi:3-methylcrotonyl-CoA carboxylase beta subunit